MIKVSFLIIGLLSLLYGAIFLITPFWFVEFSVAQETNIAWLRSIGASIVGLLFLGCLNIYMDPKGKFELLKIITITSILQTLALIYLGQIHLAILGILVLKTLKIHIMKKGLFNEKPLIL